MQGNKCNGKSSQSGDVIKHKSRRWGRAGTAVLFSGSLVATTALLYFGVPGAFSLVFGGGCPPPGGYCYPTPPPVLPGGARPWEVGIPVSTYSQWNSLQGNLLTTIPITGLSGTGPDIGIALFHNSVSVAASFDITAGMGFDLGSGWTTSYSSQLLLDDPVNPTQITVVHDDGTQDVHTKGAVIWNPPPGVHSLLEFGASTSGACFGSVWRLKHPDQSRTVYREGDAGQFFLCEIVDPVGHKLSVHRLGKAWSYRIASVTGAGGRVILFEYDANDRLEKITDPADLPTDPDTPDRSWVFSYDSSNRLATITDPGGFMNDITYDAQEHIATLSDKYETGGVKDSYAYSYISWAHTLTGVTDPTPHDQTPPQPPLTQVFLNEECCEPFDRIGTYTDRRGNDWEFVYVPIANRDANLKRITDPLGNAQTFTYDSSRNMTSYKDALNKEWSFTYDDSGDPLTATDPLSHVQTWTYDWANNLRSYTDAANNTVELHYERGWMECDTTLQPCATCSTNPETPCFDDRDCSGGTCDFDVASCKVCSQGQNSCTSDTDCQAGETCGGQCLLAGEPTLLTRIVEPPDGQGFSEAITEIDYYDTVGKEGLLRSVTGPNGVVTQFDYDGWGQPNEYIEDPIYGPEPITNCGVRRRSCGHVVANWCSPCGASEHDINCNHTSSTCCIGDPEPECYGCPQASSSSAPPTPGSFPWLPSAASPFPTVYGGYSGAQYSPKQQLTNLPATVTVKNIPPTIYTRTHQAAFDELGRSTSQSITSNETDETISRPFVYDFKNWSTGSVTRTGPDAVETIVVFDEAYRVTSVQRNLLGATYTYLANSLVDTVAYLNAANTKYTYDDAQRVTAIDHRKGINPGTRLLKLAYTYTVNNLVSSITEYDAVGQSASVTFTYDNRGRLIHEVRNDWRQILDSYDIAYEYDQGGNRKKKIEQTNFVGTTIETTYTYDIDNAPFYQSGTNRLLMWRKKRVTQGGGQQSATSGGGDPTTVAAAPGTPGGGAPAAPGPPPATTLEEAWYYYNGQGNVTRVVRRIPHELPDLDDYSATRLGYAPNGRAVTFASGETWEYSNNNKYSNPINYYETYRREFRYDGARQRYHRDAWGSAGSSKTWSDYDGDTIYNDFTAGTGSATEAKSFELGIGTFDWSGDVPDPTTTRYYHADMIGTTRLMTDYFGTITESAKYTAFGEPVGGTANRYGYAGEWGYHTDDTGDLPFLHLGARYYDPEIGRFLQRDPIGIRAGTNVYAYVFNVPTIAIDPMGRGFWSVLGNAFAGAVAGFVTGGLTGGFPGMVGGGIAGGISGGLSGSLGGAFISGGAAGVGGGLVALAARGAISAGAAAAGAGATAAVSSYLQDGSAGAVVASGLFAAVGGSAVSSAAGGRMAGSAVGTAGGDFVEQVAAATGGIVLHTACGVADFFGGD